MEWSIQEIARTAGTTSRTLRHYGDVGLLRPSRVAANGYRYYDEHALVRLQRILLLRELGLGLPAIAEVLDSRRRPEDTAAALAAPGAAGAGAAAHRAADRVGEDHIAEADGRGAAHGGRGARRVRPHPVRGGGHGALGKGGVRAERPVVARAERGAEERLPAPPAGHRPRLRRGARRGRGAGRRPGAGDRAAAVRVDQRRLRQGRGPSAEAFAGLGQMYVDDPRFGAHYDAHGEGTAVFVRDAMRVYAERELE